MIKIERTKILGWEAAIRGMRNPMNSWDKSDTVFSGNVILPIGDDDHDLMMRLRNAGSDHRKFMRMIAVYVDVTAPLYWWKEYDTYKVGTVANSCSTMHKIHERKLTLDDFSIEHLDVFNVNLMRMIVSNLNTARQHFLESNDKQSWWQMIQLLPSSYNQKRTLMLNYEVLANIYHSRKNHKLDEWRDFCKWIEGLPYAELIVGEVVMSV